MLLESRLRPELGVIKSGRSHSIHACGRTAVRPYDRGYRTSNQRLLIAPASAFVLSSRPRDSGLFGEEASDEGPGDGLAL